MHFKNLYAANCSKHFIIQWYLGIRPLWNKSNLVYVLFGRENFFLVYDLCLEYDSRARTCMSQNESWLSFQTTTSPPQHHISKRGKVRLNFHLFHLIAFLVIYFSIKQCLNYFIQPYQCTIQYANNNRISFSWERINHFPFISYGKNSFGIRPV
jgi:hypothetical protein